MVKMKSFLFILSLSLGSILFASCSSDNDEIVDMDVKVPTTFTVASGVDTRAYWDQSKTIYWESDDKVKVFVDDHIYGDVFTIVDFPVDKEPEVVTFTGDTYKHGTYYVVYPASQANTLQYDKTVHVTIPEFQTATKGTFDPSACIQIGGAADLNQTVQLKNVCAFLKITVTDKCDSVMVSPNMKGYGIVGDVAVNYSSGIDPNTGWINRKHTVTLANLPEAGTYLIAIGPSEGYQQGITVRVKYPNTDEISNSTSSNPQFAVGFVYNLGTCKKPGSQGQD